MIEWIKQNGTKITTNAEEATIHKALELGWKQAKEATGNDNSATNSKLSSRKNRR